MGTWLTDWRKRKFGGKTYILRHDATTKREAKQYAKMYEFAKIVKCQWGYDIYIR
jgi:hypothetical protein